ncbi:MAG: MmcQ/YjbR family DNA-binding protein [Pseudomonadota bacterium]
MTYDEFNAFCGQLPGTTHVVQWGGSHVWKVSGKVFAIGGWQTEAPAVTFKTSEMLYEILRDTPGYRPAPYFASRGMKWIQRTDLEGAMEDGFTDTLLGSYELVVAGLPKKVRQELAASNAAAG